MRRDFIRSGFWQVATIMEVKAYPLAAGEDASSVRYDVTVRVGSAEYVVLYVPRHGAFKGRGAGGSSEAETAGEEGVIERFLA